MSEQPATREEARRAHAATGARLSAMSPESLTAAQVEKWLTSIEGRPVRVSAPGWCELPAPLEVSGVLSKAIGSQHPDLGAIGCYELAGPAGPTASFFVAFHAITSAHREYEGGIPTVDIAMRVNTTGYRMRITASLADLEVTDA